MKSALDYIPEGQMSIFDYIEPKEKVKPKFKTGQRIYKTVLDVIETGKIKETWDVGEKYYGYRTDEDNIVFWDRDLNDTVFLDKSKAYAKAHSIRNRLTAIRKEEMKVLKEDNFIENCKDERILISATVKLLEGNMIYFSTWYTYHFLEKLKDEKSAQKRYKEILGEIESEMNDKRFKANVPVELKDMYMCQSGIWSEYEYVGRNGAVKKGETDEI